MKLTYIILIVFELGLLRHACCQSEAGCHTNEFKCDNGKCIPKLWRCDGQAGDCTDNSDEASCPKGCEFNSYFCELSFKCISNYKKCDGKADCSMGEDERDCGSNRCKPDQFRCRTAETECIAKSQVCDYTAQCSDKSDEFKESCQSVGRKYKGEVCHADYFLCKADSICLDNYYLCNGERDCSDGSDEKKCNKTTVPAAAKCRDDEIKCEVDDRCINRELLCDGHDDCLNGMDETNCPGKNVSKPKLCSGKDFFDCGVGSVCLSSAKVCDGKEDCPNGADELSCKRKASCPAPLFACADSGSCLAKAKVCDGRSDCLDGSDEANCSTPAPTVRATCDSKKFFDCDGSGRQCVPWSKVCDTHADCTVNAGADERLPRCVQPNLCSENNGGCAHNCSFDFARKQRTCSCRKGFQPNPKNSSDCVDIDECNQWGACSHSCKNFVGGFDCRCPGGYVRDIDRRRCVAIGEKALMFTTGTDVREYQFSHSQLRSVVHGLSNAVGFDIDQSKRPRSLFWSNIRGAIVRTDLTGRGMHHRILYTEQNSVPDGLMLDWTNNLLYWTDTGLDRIQVMNLTSGHYHTLLQGRKFMDEPRAIVLDPSSGWLYWSDWSESGAKISMMGMNGVAPTVILDKAHVQYPNALALDSVDRRLYYGDAKLSKIGCIDLTTKIHRDILVGHKIYPFAMTVFEDRIYWSDWIRNAVLSVDKFFGNDLIVVAQSSKPMTLRMIHPLVQLPILGRCHNHACSHICLPAPYINHLSFRYSCACPNNMKLDNNDRTCIPSKGDVVSHVPPRGHSVQLSAPMPKKVPAKTTPEVGAIAAVTTGIIITVAILATVLGVFLYGLYSRRAKSRTLTMVFDNSGLIKTNEDLYALTRSASMLTSRSSSMLKHVPNSSQLLWSSQTNTDVMEEALRGDPQV